MKKYISLTFPILLSVSSLFVMMSVAEGTQNNTDGYVGSNGVTAHDVPAGPQQGESQIVDWGADNTNGSPSNEQSLSPEEQEAANKAWQKYLEENYDKGH